MPPLGSADTALAGAAGMFLNPGLAPPAGHLGAGLGVVGALALVQLVNDHGLVNQGMVHRHRENGFVHLQVAYRLALLIYNGKFHILILRKS